MTTYASRGAVVLVCVLVMAAIAVTGWLHERRTSEIAGRAHVIDGDSLVVSGTEIRLYGIDAPESRQICSRAGRPWACGSSATSAMRALVADREVRCRPRVHDRYGRTVATCSVGGSDLGAAMVEAGDAMAYGAYYEEEREARDARRGIWSSSFERPASWRSHHTR
jgi:endonuclease YncB( thermonuclease family)